MRLSLHCLVDVYLVRFNKILAPPPLVFRLGQQERRAGAGDDFAESGTRWSSSRLCDILF